MSDKARPALLNVTGLTIVPSTVWYTYVVPEVPNELWTIDGTCQAKDLLADEVLAVTKQKALRLVPSKHTGPSPHHST